MPETSFALRSPSGDVDLHVRCWGAEPPKRGRASSSERAVVQIVHGMAEHSGRYQRLAAALNTAGYRVYGHDHRGHGRSVAPGEPLGHMGDEAPWRRAVDDVHAVNRELVRRHPDRSIAILGHSMGSYMVQQLLGEHPEDLAACVLSGSSGRPPVLAQVGRLLARIERKRLGSRGVSALIERLTFEDFNRHFAPNRTAFDWISSDPEEVDAYVADPLCGFQCTVSTWLALLDALPKLTRPDHLARIPKSLPIYIFSGTEDMVGEQGAGVRRLRDSYVAAGLEHVTCTLYDGGRHEMLHERRHAEVTRALIAWLDEHLPGA